ncbi:MAG: flagellin [Candidatus Scalinduaceae bacterium]
MGLRIQNNIAALATHRALVINDANLTRSLERLSTGFKINKASDDAAGLAVSMRFRAQILSLRQGANNASQANSLLQVAEGAADQITNILQRMKELATQAASANTTSADRTKINNEVTDLESEIDRIANSTKFSGRTLIDGNFGSVQISDFGNLVATSGVVGVDTSEAASATQFTVAINTTNETIQITQNSVSQTLTVSGPAEGSTETLNFSSFGIKITVDAGFTSVTTPGGGGVSDTISTSTSAQSVFQVGFENAGSNRIGISLADLNVAVLNSGSSADITLTTVSGAQTALTTIDNAIDTVANARADIGSAQNRLGFASANLATSIENLSAAESIIRDADLAFETVSFTKNQILIQAGTAMLAQANLAPQAVLSLLG